MKILDVSPRVVDPPHSGSRVRMYNLLRELSRRHECVGFSHVNAGRFFASRSCEQVAYSSSYTEMRYSHPVATAIQEVSERAWVCAPVFAGVALRLTRPRTLRALLRWADAVLVEFPWQFDHCRAQHPEARLIYASHNVETQKFAGYAELTRPRVSRLPWLSSIQKVEANAARRAELVLAVSPEDRLRFIDFYGVDSARVVEVPNGADTTRYAPTDPQATAAAKKALGLPNRPTVVFAGSRTPPNSYGLDWVRRLARVERRFTFLVVGPVAKAVVDGSLVCSGSVPDVTPYLAAADFAIVPIAHGGGTKIKLFESIAAGLPTVAFAEALQGTAFRDGEHVLVADKSVASLGEVLHRLADDRTLATRLGRSGREVVVEQYDWRISAMKLERALLELHGVSGGMDQPPISDG